MKATSARIKEIPAMLKYGVCINTSIDMKDTNINTSSVLDNVSMINVL